MLIFLVKLMNMLTLKVLTLVMKPQMMKIIMVTNIQSLEILEKLA